jgi:hypothetical protein
MEDYLRRKMMEHNICNPTIGGFPIPPPIGLPAGVPNQFIPNILATYMQAYPYQQ